MLLAVADVVDVSVIEMHSAKALTFFCSSEANTCEYGSDRDRECGECISNGL
jgi:hypothetical protein